MITQLTKLNLNETQAIRAALTYYISVFGSPNHDRAWSQRVILEDMLDKLYWANKETV
jgi:hypothetical protein